MVRIIVAACFALLLALPAMAQEDYPKIQTSMGYANLSFIDLNTGVRSRHSGFANETSFSLTKSLGLSNYMGIYGVGSGATLIADFFGGKATYRTSKISPYATAGLGIGYFSISNSLGYGSTSSFATRYGAGVDGPINDLLGWKVEVSRMHFHFQTTPDSSWTNGTNISVGVVFTLAQ